LFLNPRPGGVRRALSGVIRSPLIWPIGLAVVLVSMEVKIPLPAERFATLLAAAAGPCTLFAIGLFVSRLSIRAGARASWQTTVLKLVLHPLLMAALAFYVLPVDPLRGARDRDGDLHRGFASDRLAGDGPAHGTLSAASSTRATCQASRPAPSAIWCRQLVPSATTSDSGASRTAGSRLSSAIFIDTA